MSKSNVSQLKEIHHIPSLYTLPQGLSAYLQEPTPEKLKTRYMAQQLNNIISAQAGKAI